MMQPGYTALIGAIEGLITPDKAIGLAHSMYSNPELATLISGSHDRKSNTFKAALRRVERWFTSGAQKRKPSAAAKEHLASLLKRDLGAVEKASKAGGVTVIAEGTFTASSDRRKRTYVKIPLTREQFAHLAYLYNNDASPEELENAFWGEKGYGKIFDRIEGLRMEVSA